MGNVRYLKLSGTNRREQKYFKRTKNLFAEIEPGNK
jgi:hypothetical protein